MPALVLPFPVASDRPEERPFQIVLVSCFLQVVPDALRGLWIEWPNSPSCRPCARRAMNQTRDSHGSLRLSVPRSLRGEIRPATQPRVSPGHAGRARCLAFGVSRIRRACFWENAKVIPSRRLTAGRSTSRTGFISTTPNLTRCVKETGERGKPPAHGRGLLPLLLAHESLPGHDCPVIDLAQLFRRADPEGAHEMRDVGRYARRVRALLRLASHTSSSGMVFRCSTDIRCRPADLDGMSAFVVLFVPRFDAMMILDLIRDNPVYQVLLYLYSRTDFLSVSRDGVRRTTKGDGVDENRQVCRSFPRLTASYYLIICWYELRLCLL